MARFKEVKTTGPIEWARLWEHNMDETGLDGVYEKTQGAFTVNQVLSKEEWEKLKDAGTMKKPNQNRLMDGELVVKFIRPNVVTNRDGDIVKKAGGAPKVTGPDGQVWDAENFPVGNGTVAELTHLLSQFKNPEGKVGYRTSLVAVKILDYVPIPDLEDEDEAA